MFCISKFEVTLPSAVIIEKSASTAVVETVAVPDAENRPNFFNEVGNLVPRIFGRITTKSP